MSLTVTQTAKAIAANCPASFLAVGGTGPYTYAVISGGAGGTINATTGAYIGPSSVNPDPKKDFDIIRATDSLSVTGDAQIMVGTPMLLFCEIIQSEMGLPNGRVYLWDQKINQPTDSELYIAVSVPSCKPFGNVNSTSSDGLNSEQFVAMLARMDIDIISKGPSARDRKEEVILALNSDYARRQGDANSFSIGRLPPDSAFINLSQQDGAAIPYRYKISVNMQYAFKKTKPAEYFDIFTLDTILTNP